MKARCKLPVVDYGARVLFIPTVAYKIEHQDKNDILIIKDELGSMRTFASKGDAGKFFREHFEIEEGEVT